MFTPSQKVLKNYAEILVNFALNSGKGIKKRENVYLVTQLPGIPLAKEIYKTILKSGGYPILQLIEDDFKLLFLENANDQQLKFFPKPYMRGVADTIDHWIRILADKDPMFLKDADPSKLIRSNKAHKPFRDWLDEKEDAGKFTWTLCLYGTEGMAKEAGMDVKEYWKQIEKACFLQEKKPIQKWQEVHALMKKILNKLNQMPIHKVHIEAKETDLWVEIGEKRKWLGGSGRNIPSFEVFTSPDWRGTEGNIYFDLPLYRYGNIIEGIHLIFKNGKIVKATASKNEKLLLELLKQKNANKIGEFSLTDTRLSKISRFMANTLYDENFGGKFGNTHLAVGKAYHDACTEDSKKMKPKDYEQLGYNDSIEHTDIIASSDRMVTAYLKDGSTKVIYKKGKFTI